MSELCVLQEKVQGVLKQELCVGCRESKAGVNIAPFAEGFLVESSHQ